MLRSLVAKITWIFIFGLGQANDSFPPCIRITADLYEQDTIIHYSINQDFTLSDQDVRFPRYISNDGEYEFQYKDYNYKWRLFPKGLPNNVYLKAPAVENAEGTSIRDPLLIEEDTWLLYCGQNCWESATNPVKVVCCKDDDCPQSSEHKPDESNQETESNQPEQTSNQQPQISNEQQEVSSQQPHVLETAPGMPKGPGIELVTLPTTQISTMKQRTSAPKTIPDCIEIKADLSFIENNNDGEVKIESLLKVLKAFKYINIIDILSWMKLILSYNILELMMTTVSS